MYKIPLISKMPEYTGLPEFYDEAKDCRVKIKNEWFYDFSVIGASACILGYNDFYVNHHVKKCINKGNFSSLNSRYMEKLTNLLLAIHPKMSTIRYGKSAGEMLYLALELAKEKIKSKDAVFLNKKSIYQIGYNGWIIKNGEKIEHIENEIFTKKHFENINDLQNIKERPDILIFELVRHENPKVIEKINEWQEQGSILIVDEVTTGFRFCCGGLYQLYNLNPDMVIYAKGISNGYPMSCIVGKEKIMQSDLWISSTYWTDSIGFVAAYYTIKKLKYCNYLLLKKIGNSVMSLWKSYSKKYDIPIKLGEIPYIANFEFGIGNKNDLKSLFIQEMQKKGILALDQFYPTFAHNTKSLKMYSKALDFTFSQISKYLKGKPIKFKVLQKANK